jgi:hypothetical protein
MICPYCHQEAGIGTAALLTRFPFPASRKCRNEFLIANISVGLSMKSILLAMSAGQRNRDW